MRNYKQILDKLIYFHNWRNNTFQKHFEMLVRFSKGDASKLDNEFDKILETSKYLMKWTKGTGAHKSIENIYELISYVADGLQDTESKLDYLADYDIRDMFYKALSNIAHAFFYFWDGESDELYGEKDFTDDEWDYLEEIAELLNPYD